MDRRIIAHEIEWHEKHVVGSWQPTKFSAEVIDTYRHNRDHHFNPKQFMFHSMGNLDGLYVLDVGSGQGINAVEMALLGARVTGVELCPGLVEESRSLAIMNEVEDRCQFILSEATEYHFGEETYDVVLIDNVLHHIPSGEFTPLFAKLNRGLKPGGRFIIREPIACSSLLAKVKKLLWHGSHATPDEHELNRQDIDQIAASLGSPAIHFFDLAARVARLMHRPKLLRFVMKIDRGFLRALPPCRSLAGCVVIVGNRLEQT